MLSVQCHFMLSVQCHLSRTFNISTILFVDILNSKMCLRDATMFCSQ
jgi:hypothetical protein